MYHFSLPIYLSKVQECGGLSFPATECDVKLLDFYQSGRWKQHFSVALLCISTCIWAQWEQRSLFVSLLCLLYPEGQYYWHIVDIKRKIPSFERIYHEWDWASFLTSKSHLYFHLYEQSIYILYPFVYWVMVFSPSIIRTSFFTKKGCFIICDEL